MRKRKYQFRLFGGLYLTVDGKTFALNNELGKQLSAILAFLLCNYKQVVSKEKMIDNFWPDSDNPTNALKFAVHRLRNALKKIDGLPEAELVVTATNGYQFNPDLYVELDTEVFEKNVLNAKSDSDLEMYHESIELYKGDFLDGIEEEWAITDRGYYRSIFTQICHTVAIEYMKEDNFKAAIDVCEKGLDADEFEETLIYTYLEALVKDQRYNFAKKYYNEINKKYQKRVGLSLDDVNVDKSFDKLVNEQVGDDGKTPGAFSYVADQTSFVGPMVVDTNTFKALCSYEVRNVARYNYKDYIIEMVIESSSDDQKVVMETFMNILKMSFRKTDVVTKLDDRKIALLVKLAHETDVEILYSRIQRRLSEQVGEFNYDFTYEMKKVC
jgi:DNA-binding SARP family transcriptional activator